MPMVKLSGQIFEGLKCGRAILRGVLRRFDGYFDTIGFKGELEEEEMRKLTSVKCYEC